MIRKVIDAFYDKVIDALYDSDKNLYNKVIDISHDNVIDNFTIVSDEHLS